MSPTNFIKFYGFILHLKPNNVTLSPFPEKIPEPEKKNYYFSVGESPNVAPKPTDQSRSNSISRLHLQISLARIFVYDLSL